MKPIEQMDDATAAAVCGVLTDIDGTLTDEGRLHPEAYEALWALKDAGLWVVPVTGRPAGWCDLIVRQWPVHGVVGENGALALWEADGRLNRMKHPNVGDPERLAPVREAILAEVPGSRVAQDQPYRRFDLAIDFCEDPPDLGLEAAERIRAVFERFGAHAKISNIHVNGWFGDYDKLSMVKLFMQERFGCDIEADRDRLVFCGDSPNDEPMFAYFGNACGVANVHEFSSRMQHLPAFVSEEPGGAGFTEIAQRLLRMR